MEKDNKKRKKIQKKKGLWENGSLSLLIRQGKLRIEMLDAVEGPPLTLKGSYWRKCV